MQSAVNIHTHRNSFRTQTTILHTKRMAKSALASTNFMNSIRRLLQSKRASIRQWFPKVRTCNTLNIFSYNIYIFLHYSLRNERAHKQLSISIVKFNFNEFHYIPLWQHRHNAAVALAWLGLLLMWGTLSL